MYLRGEILQLFGFLLIINIFSVFSVVRHGAKYFTWIVSLNAWRNSLREA